ncbi:lysogeny maintenance protein PflM, partial [Pseudomonas aeruginosa]
MAASPYYLRQTHAPDCACSVCWSVRQAIPLHNPSPCPDCRPPGLPYLEDGR